jgi:predicted small lipoprotein YifL
MRPLLSCRTGTEGEGRWLSGVILSRSYRSIVAIDAASSANAAVPRAAALNCHIPSTRHGGYTAPMNRRLALASAALLVVLPLVLSGCGNKGPLVLPDKPADAAVPAEAPAPEATPAVDVTTDATTPAPPASGTPAR